MSQPPSRTAQATDKSVKAQAERPAMFVETTKIIDPQKRAEGFLHRLAGGKAKSRAR